MIKPVEFLGDSLDALRRFPQDARRQAGFQLDRVQHGLDPDDWKPMKSIGVGVKEIRIRDAEGAFRVIYVAKFEEAVYVLHCFQKKAEKTEKAALVLARARLKELSRGVR
jgi:phage-related protein